LHKFIVKQTTGRQTRSLIQSCTTIPCLQMWWVQAQGIGWASRNESITCDPTLCTRVRNGVIKNTGSCNESDNSIPQQKYIWQHNQNSIQFASMSESQTNGSVSEHSSQPNWPLPWDSLSPLLQHFQEGITADAGSNPLHPLNLFLFWACLDAVVQVVTYDHLTIGICLASLDQCAPTKLLIQTDLKTVLCVYVCVCACVCACVGGMQR